MGNKGGQYLQRRSAGAIPWKTRPARRPPPPLNRFASKIAKPIYKKFGFSEPHIFEHWTDIVGSKLARRALPQRLSHIRGRRDRAILTIRVQGASALELQHIAPQVIERINAYYGFQAVGELKFVQGPLPAAPLARRQKEPSLSLQETEDIKTDLAALPEGRLKSALEDMGRHVRTKSLNNGARRT